MPPNATSSRGLLAPGPRRLRGDELDLVPDTPPIRLTPGAMHDEAARVARRDRPASHSYTAAAPMTSGILLTNDRRQIMPGKAGIKAYYPIKEARKARGTSSRRHTARETYA